MAVLKFRVYLEEDDAVYRDIIIRHKQSFEELHTIILKAYEFDCKHQATFFRSNDNWDRGREISFAQYDKKYIASPLIMADTTIGSEIKDTNQKFVYVYDFLKNWTFLVQLIHVDKEENPKTPYPSITRKEGIGPQQYGTKSLLAERFADIEEKYDLAEANDGFGEEGENLESDSNDGEEDAAQDIDAEI